MKSKELDAAVIFDTGGACGRKLHEANGCEFVVLALDPASEIAPHVLDIPVSFYVVAGIGVLVADGVSYDIASGDLVQTTAGSERAVRNTGEAELKLLVVKHIG